MFHHQLVLRKAPEPSLQELPEDLRVRLFEKYITNSKDILSLRKVCRLFHHEIDHLVGILSLISLDECTLQEPEIRYFYSTVAFRHIQYDYIFETHLQDITLTPSKLETIIISGSIRSSFIQQILDQCPNLTTLHVKADITSPILQPLLRRKFLSLKKLKIISGYMHPVPVKLRKLFSEVRTNNALALLWSIQAPKLTSLKFELLHTDSVDLLDVTNALFRFILNHPSLQKLDISIKFDGGIDESDDNDFGTELGIRNAYNIDDQRRKTQEELLQSMKKSQRFSRTFETLKLVWNLQKESGLWIKYLDTFKNLKNLGLKLAGPYLWSQISPTVSANSHTLTNIFIQCTFKSAVNFSHLEGCLNLESLSLHHQKYPSRPLIRLTNIPTELSLLPRLKVLIIDGLVVSGVDMEMLTTWNLKVLGLRGVVAVDYFGDDQMVIHPGQGNDEEVLQGGLGITGVTYHSFMNMINSRSLDALLVDMDSISVTIVDHGMKILDARDTISGKFQSLFLDISDWDSKDSDCVSASAVPYWRSTFLGFSVQFPFLPS